MNKTNEKPCHISDEETEKFMKKFDRSFGEYRYAYILWRNNVIEAREKYNGFGLPDISMSPHILAHGSTLLKTYIDIELKKTKNKKYKIFLNEATEIFKEKAKEDAIWYENYERKMLADDKYFAARYEKEKKREKLLRELQELENQEKREAKKKTVKKKAARGKKIITPQA